MNVLFITLGGLLGAKFSAGMQIGGKRVERELGAVWRHYRWNQGRLAAKEAADFDGVIVLAWHSAGETGAARFVTALNREIALAFAVDSWLKGQVMNPLIKRVYSITAGKGGRFNVLGGNVVEEIVYPDETHTSIDDEPALHYFFVEKIGEIMTDQSTPPVVPVFGGEFTHNRFDRKKFFDAVRETIFDGKLNQTQVEGLERLLDVWEESYSHWDFRELAYDLATGFHETARAMQPIYEGGSRSYFNMYEPGTSKGKRLGNTVHGDGFLFRGAGDVQNTGRGNAAKATKRLNELFDLGVDLVANPEMRLDPFISGHSLFLGNHEGWWTTLKLPNYAGYGHWDMEAARGVVNGSDRWHKIGGYAGAFLEALKVSALHNSIVQPDTPVPVDPVPVPTGELTLENLRTWSSAELMLASIKAADLIKIALMVRQERDNPETGTKAAISPPIIEETDMTVFTETKSIFKSKRFWGLVIGAVGMFVPAAKPIVDMLVPTVTGASPEMIDQLQSNANDLAVGIKQLVAAAGMILAAIGAWKAETKLSLK
ncbi:MAG: hypothetical protein COA78_38830 [Blastopirellula sp.]|nr:MAG: hypothetical protein COA78_38830 [Blastopirellula sp.]